jgi:predicted flap endonuclease-1-like 5' DNA nuclease
MRDGFRTEGRQRSQQLGDELGAFVSGLAENVSRMMAGFGEQRLDMARSARSERAGYVAELTESVAQLQKKVAAMRAAFVSELTCARAGWRRNGQARDAGRPHEANSGAPEADPVRVKDPMAAQDDRFSASAEATEEPEPEEDMSLSGPEAGQMEEMETEAVDDLTAIQGIGPGRLRRLNDAGIFTYSQLAQSSVDALKDALGEASRLVDVGKWIELAKNMI